MLSTAGPSCTCLAVTHEDGAEVVVWDANGTPRTFRYKGKPDNLCFQMHNSDIEGANLTTPCFDKDGIHDDPEEVCSCGVETPHLHAHVHKEGTCCATAKDGLIQSELTSVILHANEEEGDKHCESSNHHHHHLKKETQHEGKRYHSIYHDHADGKEQLILGYNCDDCGDGGLEGNFPLVSKRKLDNDVQVHLFEAKIDAKPCNWTECLRHMQNADIFDSTSERVQMAFNLVPNTKKSPSRSIGVKECSQPFLSPEFAEIVRAGLDKCCEDECCSASEAIESHTHHNHKDAFDHHHCKTKHSCNEKSCSFATHEKADDHSSINHGKASHKGEKSSNKGNKGVSTSSSVHHEHSHEHKAHNDKESCCSGKSPSSSVHHEHKTNNHKKSCCSGKSRSFTAKAKHLHSSSDCHGSHHHEHILNDDTSCCTDGKSCSVAKKGATTNFDSGNNRNCNEHKTKAKDKCCSKGTCKTASTVTDWDNDSIDDFPLINDNEVRSVIDCSQICCAAEIPMINKVLDPLDGIGKVLINVPNKCVMVDHVPSTITAKDIVDILNKAHFGATLKRDGATTSASTVGRSQLFVEGICCASEIPAINRMLAPLKGVIKVSINVQGKLVFADHDTEIVSAQQLCDVLNEKCFGACVRHDAVDDQTETLSNFVRSTIAVITGFPSTKGLKAFMSSYSGREIESFIADTTEKKIHIVHNPLVLPIDEIVSSLEEHHESLEVSVEIDGAKSNDWDFPPLEEVEDSSEEMQSLPKPTVMLSGLFWVVSMFSYIGGNWEYLNYVALVSVVIGLPPIGVKAVVRLRSFQFDTNVLMCSAVAGSLALQEFAEAAAVTFLFSISDWLERRATTRARNALSEIVQLRPSQATIFHPATKELIAIPASSVPVGALVSVKAGAQIPCDGIVVGGRSVVDESSLTGESRPVKKGVKDKVNGGTINSGMNELLIRTTSSSENSAVSRLIRLVEEAQANRSETEKMVDAFAKRYTPVVIAGALLMVSIPWAWGVDVGRRWTKTGLILLVVACPCALIISTPVTYVAGLAATAQRGILIKGGAYLEALGKVKKVAFDKTGTLTKGQFALLHLKCFGDMKREDVLGYLAMVEERASHPIAEAIVTAVKNEGVSVPKNVSLKDLTELEGEGVTAMAGNVRLYSGNQRLFDRLGFDIPKEAREGIESWEKLGGTVGYLGVEGKGVVCAYCCTDSPREESARVLQTLKEDGIRVVMLTGDNRDAALLIGAQIGLDESDIKYELLPEDKLIIIGDMMENKGEGLISSCFKESELVMMCGDGINDAPALAKCDIGLAMGEGAALAMETSDLTLLDSDLEKLLYSIKMGKAVNRKIRENIIFSFVTKAIVVVTTLSGYSYLWAAIAVDVGSMLVVTLNGMMLLPSKGERKKSYILTNQIE